MEYALCCDMCKELLYRRYFEKEIMKNNKTTYGDSECN